MNDQVPSRSVAQRPPTARGLRAAAILAAALTLACQPRTNTNPSEGSLGTAQAHADRLPPGQSLPSSEVAFGFELPRGLRLTRHFSAAAHLVGQRPFDEVLTALAGQVSPNRAEMETRRAVLRRVQRTGDPAGRWFRIEVERLPHGTHVTIKDITPPAAEPGLTEAARWERVGRGPAGEQTRLTELR